jgi:hypothetical protein
MRPLGMAKTMKARPKKLSRREASASLIPRVNLPKDVQKVSTAL